MRRLEQIDVIRGLAALTVVITHVSFYYSDGPLAVLFNAFAAAYRHTFYANGGLYAGVIVFIVLSGFCIHMPVAKQPHLVHEPGFWGVYGKRRALRILPVFAVGAGLAVLLSGSWDARTILRLIFVGPFYPVGFPPGNEPLDTVIAEMWLYAAYPVTFAIYRKYGALWLLGLACAIYAVPALCVAAGADAAWAGRSWYAFYLYWVIGLLAVEAFVAKKPLALSHVALAFGAYVLLCHVVNFKGSHYLKGALLAMCTAMLLVAWRGSNPFGKMFVRMGEASYTLYVVHSPAIAVWLMMAPERTALNQLGLLAFIAAVTALLYIAVEGPSHRFAQSFRASSYRTGKPFLSRNS